MFKFDELIRPEKSNIQGVNSSLRAIYDVIINAVFAFMADP